MENSFGFGMSRFGDDADLELDPYDAMDMTKVLKESNGDKKKDKKTVASEKKEVEAQIDNKKAAGKAANGRQNDSRNHVKFADQGDRNLRNKGDSAPQGQRRDGDRPPRRLDARRYEGGPRPPRRDGENRPPRRTDGEGRPPFRQDGDRPRWSEGGRPGGRRPEGEERNGEGGAPRRFENGEMARGRGRGMGRGRGGRGGRREFDRRSGSDRTGVKSLDKRGGSGPHNWGADGEQTEDVEGAEQARGSDGEATEEKPAGEETQVNGAETAEAAPKEPEEPKEMTLDEYKTMMAAKRVKPEFNVRKAGEGEDTSQWKETYVLNSGRSKTAVEASAERELKNQRSQKVDSTQEHKVKRQVDTNFFFSDSVGRGGRGRGRGGRGSGRGRGYGGDRMGGRGNRESKPSAPRMDSEGDFPSLM